MSHHVIVLGGGVAGISAAHELVERGFRVTVYEKGTVGGKARSFGVPSTGTNQRRDLPAEHGFRFFPGFYRHLPDTMKRIPYGTNPEGVFDNLRDTTQMQIQFDGKQFLVVPARFPRSLDDIVAVLGASGYLTTAAGLKPDDIQFYAARVWQLLTSCEERRAHELEGVSWWDYIDAENRSDIFKAYCGRTPRVLVAANPKVANTKTVGDILLQLLFNMVEPGVAADRVLNGPTSAVWIHPWLTYLQDHGVHYERDATVIGLDCAGGRIRRLHIRQNNRDRWEQADYHVAALPVEKMADLITSAMLEADPTLEGIKTLAGHVDWMNGIQFYLREEVPLVFGHQMYLGSPWALTSLSQAQFWYDNPTDFARDYGDGTVRTVLSVDVSDWNEPGLNHKRAKDCSRDEVAKEVWRQLRVSLPDLVDADLHPNTPWFLDPAIQPVDGSLANAEPLLVNQIKSWELRPSARTRISNLFLASDYVRTHTNLATMEAANEAARRAVNAILDASGVKAPPCRLWDLHEPVWVKPWRWFDLLQYRRGLPWAAEFPPFVQDMARAVLENAPAIGSPDEYADFKAREVAERGVTLVPSYVQQAVADVVLGVGSALERGDVAELRTFFTSGAPVRLDGALAAAASWLDSLELFFAKGGRIAIDIRSLQEIRPSKRLVVARFAADAEVVGIRPPTPGRPGRLEVTLGRAADTERTATAGSWVIHELHYTASG